MAVILKCGECLDVDDSRWDETGRFQLILQTDGNLVLYAYALRPTPRRFATASTRTYGLGSDVQVHLAETGVLCIRSKSNPATVYASYPHKICIDHGSVKDHRPPKYIWYPYQIGPAPGSTLHLQSDGNLVLYGPNHNPGDGVPWSMGVLLQDLDPENNPDAPKIVNPNALSLPVNDGVLSHAGSTVIRNDSDRTVEVVTSSSRPIQLQRGGFTAIAPSSPQAMPAGSLFLPDFSAGNLPPAGDGEAVRPLNPGEVIAVTELAPGRFSLVGA
jgi:hypothetical protein